MSPFSFLAGSDGVALTVLAALAALSIASWSVLLVKAGQTWRAARRDAAFLAAYRHCATPHRLRELLDRQPVGGTARLAEAALEIGRRWHSRRDDSRPTAARFDDLLDRALIQALLAVRLEAERGLPLLATVASSAPFVGLFGTVWGIHGALLAIGASGQAGLDKVAGPIGEALVMTALGLAVALPAALAYNALQGAARRRLVALECFAQELHAFLSTGVAAPPRPDTAAPALGIPVTEAA